MGGDFLSNKVTILAEIIGKLKLPDRSKEHLLNVISNFNQDHNKNLTFENFEKKCWIRLINNDVFIPEVVGHSIWKLQYSEEKKEEYAVSDIYKDMLRCLRMFAKDRRGSISTYELNEILENWNSKATLDILLSDKTLEYDELTTDYFWTNQDNFRYLTDEICATLWQLLCGPNTKEEGFRMFLRRINAAHVWPHNLENFLPPDAVSLICELSVSFLNTELDLVNTGLEFEKIWLDSANYAHVTLNDQIPYLKLQSKTSLDLIEEIEHHRRRFHALFEFGHCRSSYRLVLSFLMKFKQIYHRRSSLVNLLKDSNKPYIVWTIYHEISSEFPEFIPFLLEDSNLAPLAFKCLDKIAINPNFLFNQNLHSDEQVKEKYDLINRIWLELFEIVLDEIAISQLSKEELGQILYHILYDLVKKVFSSNGIATNEGLIKHQSLRVLYEKALKMLATKRQTNTINFGDYINPRFAPMWVVSTYLALEGQASSPWFNEISSLNYAKIDLKIELLKIANLRYLENELPAGNFNLSAQASSMVDTLFNDLVTYYLQTETEVETYDEKGPEIRKIKRSGQNFGCEIIDWPYLFLSFHKNEKLDALDGKFKQSVLFDTATNEGIYADSNQLQYENIREYLKTIMLAYLGISKQRELYEAEGLMVNETLGKLEKLIEDHSLNYSVDALNENRIDVFNERFRFVESNLYYDSMIGLLYKCINLSKNANRSNFVALFFNTSIDLGRMLTAINILEDKELKEVISKRIQQINIADFIQSVSTVKDLEEALISAVNSDTYWKDFAEPLIERIKRHFTQRNYSDPNSLNIMYEIDLLLAFKKASLQSLEEIEVPDQHNNRVQSDKQKRKAFFIALHNLYNEKKYDVAIHAYKKTPLYFIGFSQVHIRIVIN